MAPSSPYVPKGSSTYPPPIVISPNAGGDSGGGGIGGGFINLNRSPPISSRPQPTYASSSTPQATPRKLPDPLPVPSTKTSRHTKSKQTQRRSSSPPAPPSSYRPEKETTRRRVRTSAEAYAHAQSVPRKNGKTDILGMANNRIAPSSTTQETEKEKEKSTTSKPIFDWISRKLGTARRATISESIGSASSPKLLSIPLPPRSKLPSPQIQPMAMTSPPLGGRAGEGPNGRRSKSSHRYRHQSGNGGVDLVSLRRDNSTLLSRAESQSIVSFSMRTANTIEREANNPYPSIPIPSGGRRGRMQDDQTTMSMSLSYVSRSSLDDEDEESSRMSRRRRRSMEDDMDGRSTTTSQRKRLLDNETENDNENAADDDASLRPFPPSHPASPTPSTSFRTRSRSASLLSPPHTSHSHSHGYGLASGEARSARAITVYSTSSNMDGRSFISSAEDHASDNGDIRRVREEKNADGDDDDEESTGGGRQSRQDSTSTKPTTCISFDSSAGIAHIAQAPSTPVTPPTPHLETAVMMANSPVTASEGGESPHGVIESTTSEQAPSSRSSPARGHAAPDLDPRLDSESRGSPARAVTSSKTPNTPKTPTLPSTSTSPTSVVDTAATSVSIRAGPPTTLTQAPKHTAPHPIHNPHPSSPPDPNASTLTLASSTFALVPPPAPSTVGGTSFTSPPSIHRLREVSSSAVRPTSLSTSPSITWAPAPAPAAMPGLDPLDPRPGSMHEGSVHHYNTMGPPSLSMSLRGWVGDRSGHRVADRDASVRALRRQGSWESYESGWSWRGLGAPVTGMGVEGTGLRTSMVSPTSPWAGGLGGEDMGLILPSNTSQRGSVYTRMTSKSEGDDGDELGSGAGAGAGASGIGRIDSPVGVAIAA
ncbi:hypothetical protein IAR55_000400 [Kwoniella newhampshirensis]|uniref:Uncharacterized protein n=1 Tax=Kwoniella newhampshirensis TaxID=1651941 RepID=A0AAW0Z6I1_9TREE